MKLTNKTLVDMMADLGNGCGLSIEGQVEAIKSEMCDTRCKYPDQYGISQNDAGWDAMNEEVCNTCPLNAL